MPNIAQQLMDLNVFFNDGQWAGLVEGYTPPELESQTDEYRAAGMYGHVALRTGQELMESEIVFKGQHEEVYLAWGIADATIHTIEVRGALQGYGGEVTPIVFTQTGPIIKVMSEQLQGQGEVPEMTLTQNPHYFKIEHGGAVSIEIDVLNAVMEISGEDQLAAIREAIGL